MNTIITVAIAITALGMAFIAFRFKSLLALLKITDLKDTIKKQEIQFFNKYANVTEEYRTVTLTQAILQTLSTRQNLAKLNALPNADEMRKAVIAKLQAQKNGQSESRLENKQADSGVKTSGIFKDDKDLIKFEDELAFKITTDCSIEDINQLDLKNIDQKYEDYVSGIFPRLGRICLCPDGENYCNWTASMFSQFIVNLNVWNLVSIEVINCDADPEVVISSSSMTNFISTLSGDYAVVIMSNQAGLLNLAPGAHVKVVFKWLEMVNGVEVSRCIILRNVIPVPSNEYSDSSNGVLVKSPELA